MKDISELKIIPADPISKEFKIKFAVTEYIGVEIYKFDADNNIIQSELSKYDDLYSGCRIAVPGPFRNLYSIMYVKDDLKSAKSQSGNYICFLEFDKDDRHCWVCSGTANLAAIKKLEIYNDIKDEN